MMMSSRSVRNMKMEEQGDDDDSICDVYDSCDEYDYDDDEY